jgi:predicted transglutaminase-like cysteine proteinase
VPAVNSRIVKAAKFAVVLASLYYGIVLAAGLLIDQALLDKVDKKYGAAAKQRFVDWQELIDNGKAWPESEKLERVNNFFNRNIEFVDDIILWQKIDYWAAPTELLAKGAGDCEDYSIAKYFTLVEMGVDENKLRITYVKALELNQAHMVLTYFDSPRAVPLVLDNLKPDIMPATQRNDLQPVYSFNGTGLWLAKSKGSGQHVGGSDRLSMWTELKLRMLESPF